MLEPSTLTARALLQQSEVNNCNEKLDFSLFVVRIPDCWSYRCFWCRVSVCVCVYALEEREKQQHNGSIVSCSIKLLPTTSCCCCCEAGRAAANYFLLIVAASASECE
jgi:hypothetical protein